MDNIQSTGLKLEDSSLYILDQQLLPLEENWIRVEDPQHMVRIIIELKVRGAPMIGISACLALALFAEKGASPEQIRKAAAALSIARPTAVNLKLCIDRLLSAYGSENNTQALVDAAVEIFHEDVELCERIATAGAELLDDSESILTICNTGRIATAGKGTALGIIYKAHEIGKNVHVYISETRPLLQGGRLTSWELQKHEVPCTLICDSAAATLMSQGKVSRVFAGADRIACNGDSANKIGTYSLAVLAKHHNIPFYIAAPWTTLDPDCDSGATMEIEQRKADEVRGVKGSFGSVCWSPKDVPVYNPAFDVTPIELITGIVLDRGYFSQKEILKGALKSGEMSAVA